MIFFLKYTLATINGTLLFNTLRLHKTHFAKTTAAFEIAYSMSRYTQKNKGFKL